MKQTPRLPLADIYLELGLLSSQDETERQRAQERILALREEERLAEEERRIQERVTDALARAPRLVILGGPGSGKTISLRFIALMLARGHGAAQLGLDVPYIPLMIRLADYTRELENDPAPLPVQLPAGLHRKGLRKPPAPVRVPAAGVGKRSLHGLAGRAGRGGRSPSARSLAAHGGSEKSTALCRPLV